MTFPKLSDIWVRCAIYYHMHHLKNGKNTHGGVLLLVELQAEAYNFDKSKTPPWVFFTFFKLYEWYQIAQSTTYFLANLMAKAVLQKVMAI